MEYHYGTESQARFMAAVLKLGPSRLPPAQRLVAEVKKRKYRAKRAEDLSTVTPEEIDGALEGLGGLDAPQPGYDFADDGEGVDITFDLVEETATVAG